MRKILLLLSLCAITVSAQTTSFGRVASRYKTVKSATANVQKTRHRNAIKDDVVTKGTLTIGKPDLVSISTNGGKDKLVMNGTRFTMAVSGKEQTTDSRKNPQFATFHTVLSSLLNGGTTDIGSLPDVKTEETSANLTITITPTTAKGKPNRRAMFTSLVLVLDKRTSAFKSLRMEERGGNYTLYTFSDFTFDPK